MHIRPMRFFFFSLFIKFIIIYGIVIRNLNVISLLNFRSISIYVSWCIKSFKEVRVSKKKKKKINIVSVLSAIISYFFSNAKERRKGRSKGERARQRIYKRDNCKKKVVSSRGGWRRERLT